MEWKPSDLHKCGGGYKASNCPKSTLYKQSFSTRKRGSVTIPLKLEFYKFRETNLIIGGFLASHHRFTLIVFFPFQAFQNIEIRNI